MEVKDLFVQKEEYIVTKEMGDGFMLWMQAQDYTGYAFIDCDLDDDKFDAGRIKYVGIEVWKDGDMIHCLGVCESTRTIEEIEETFLSWKKNN